VTEGTGEQERGIGGMSRRMAAWLAWSLWALSVGLTASSLVLLALIRSHPNVHVFDWWLGHGRSGWDGQSAATQRGLQRKEGRRD
jgi:hypothetical protein